jgi:hypothetical protein
MEITQLFNLRTLAHVTGQYLMELLQFRFLQLVAAELVDTVVVVAAELVATQIRHCQSQVSRSFQFTLQRAELHRLQLPQMVRQRQFLASR